MKSLILLVVMYGIQAQALNYSSELFEQNSNKSKKIATMTVQARSEGGKDYAHVEYKDLNGEPLYIEDTVLVGSEIEKVEVDQRQTKQKALIEVKDGKVFFSVTEKDKTKTSDEKKKDTLVMPANFSRHIKDHWETISSGKTHDFRYGVWFRKETVGFEIFKIGEEEVAGQKAIVLKMKPSSFIIAAIVKPIIFKYSADGDRLLEMNGRVPIKKEEKGSFKDLDAEVVYIYPAEESTVSTTTVPAKKTKSKK